VSPGYPDALFEYLAERDIRVYRMASGLAPYATHPAHTQMKGQVEMCADELARLGAWAREMGLRLSFHPCQRIKSSGQSLLLLIATADRRRTVVALRTIPAEPSMVGLLAPIEPRCA